MKSSITSLVVLIVLTVLTISTYSWGKSISSLKVIDANGQPLGKVVGIEGGGKTANVASTVGGELVIFYLIDGGVKGSTDAVYFETVNNCTGQAYIPDLFGLKLILTAVVDVDNSVYKVLDRDPGLFKALTVESQLPSGDGCEDISFFLSNLLPATRLGDLSEFTLPFEYVE